VQISLEMLLKGTVGHYNLLPCGHQIAQSASGLDANSATWRLTIESRCSKRRLALHRLTRT